MLADQFRRNVRRLRTARGLTQKDLAARAGIHRVYVSNLELGIENNPTLSTLERFSKALEVPAVDLLREKPRALHS